MKAAAKAIMKNLVSDISETWDLAITRAPLKT